ncbi:MAG: hypothetical protein ACT4QF_01990 [Sporichthyaceae bacterium]
MSHDIAVRPDGRAEDVRERSGIDAPDRAKRTPVTPDVPYPPGSSPPAVADLPARPS